jgi:excisionase family DNA binding protein
MVCLASPDKEWLTVSEAAETAGCTVGWIRLLLGRGDLEGWKAGERAWLVKAEAAKALRATLSDRSVGRRHAKKPVTKRRKSR